MVDLPGLHVVSDCRIPNGWFLSPEQARHFLRGRPHICAQDGQPRCSTARVHVRAVPILTGRYGTIRSEFPFVVMCDCCPLMSVAFATIELAAHAAHHHARTTPHPKAV